LVGGHGGAAVPRSDSQDSARNDAADCIRIAANGDGHVTRLRGILNGECAGDGRREEFGVTDFARNLPESLLNGLTSGFALGGDRGSIR
jgi:hypothetical protein